MPALTFTITRSDSTCAARLGRVTTPHGSFDTPAFMPVGTQATIKGLLPSTVADLGAQIILANTFHLMLRPGSDLIAAMAGAQGLHDWMRWDGPILTDSGGFQVFSLGQINKISDEGVTFRSPHDGSRVDLTPERSMQVQNELGADIIMAFDDCPPAGDEEAGVKGQESGDRSQGTGEAGPQTDDSLAKPRDEALRIPGIRTRIATHRSLAWLARCVKAHARKADQALFGIVQGGTDLDLRTWCVDAVLQYDLPGYAIGGVAVGEGFEQIKRVVEHTAPLLPREKPRYLMGVGYERDIVAAVRAGVDMFDCVLPTRNGRNGNAFTRHGQLRLRNARYARDPRPIDERCDCLACKGEGQGPGAKGQGEEVQSNPHSTIRNPQSLGPWPSSLGPSGFSRSYLRHLFMAGEMLGPILVSIHNLRHFQRLMLDIRRAIADDGWSSLYRDWPVAGERLKLDKD
ncbi:MAG: tRNA guanosine(34) transglycosylase Tgt [Phycisphaeraceae bacterium]